LQQTGPILGAEFLARSVIYAQSEGDTTRMGYIKGIQPIDEAMRHAAKLAVFDQENLWILDLHGGTAQCELDYRKHGYFARPLLIDVDGDGSREIACRGGGFSDVALLDATGNVEWRIPGNYKRDVTANSMAVGDLDRDGTAELYVANTNGLQSLSADGSTRWRAGGEREIFWHVEVFDSNLPSTHQVVASVQPHGRHQPKYLDFFQSHGELVRRVMPGRPFTDFRLVRWQTTTAPMCILVRSGSKLALLNDEGAVIWEYHIPRKYGSGFGIEATLVRFSDNSDPCLAVLLGTRSAWRRSILCVFSLNGELLYQEILGETRGLLATRLEGASAKGQVLLTGNGVGTLVAYQRHETVEGP